MPDSPSTPPSSAPAAQTARPRGALARPVILRAIVALAFGAATVFWGAPTAVGAAWCLGVYFAGLAVARGWQLREEGRGRTESSPTGTVRVLSSVAYGLAAAIGIVLGAAPDPAVLAIGAAAAFGLTGASDLVGGISGRRRSPLARDQVITGVVHLGAAALLPFFAALGPHALLGVAGGAAIITGVLLAIAGLSLGHDSAAGADVA